METAINMQSVYVTDLVGIAILVIIMVTRGWSLPGRKLESRLMMALLAVSMFNYRPQDQRTSHDPLLGLERRRDGTSHRQSV